jgi:hypothetical protein
MMIRRVSFHLVLFLIIIFYIFNSAEAANDNLAYANLCKMLEKPDANLVTTFLSQHKFDLNEPCDGKDSFLGSSEPQYLLEILINPRQNYGKWDTELEVAEVLIKNGAKLDQLKPDGTTVFLSIWKELRKDEYSRKVLEFVLNKGISLKTQILPATADSRRFLSSHDHTNDSTGANALMLLVNDFESRASLCAPSSYGHNGDQCLEIMAMFQLLIKNSDLKAKDAYGRTALHRAAESKGYNVARLLIEAGADRSEKDYVGLTPADYAISSSDGKMLALLQSSEVTPQKLPVPAAQNEATQAPEATVEEKAPLKAEEVPVGSITQLPTVSVDEKPTVSITETVAPTPIMQPLTLQSALSKQKSGKLSEARTDLIKLSNGGDLTANYELGRMYAKGEGGTQDFNQARKHFEYAAQGNHPQALFALGLMYVRGDGVTKDKEKARTYLKKAANLGSKEAKSLLGNL